MRTALLIAKDSPEYSDALKLRHGLFFREHSIPFESTADEDEPRSLHVAVPDGQGGVLACGRLTPEGGSVWRISQMAVRPDCGRQGLGALVMEKLVAEARKRGAKVLVLAARTSAEGFYARFGFITVGKEFPSGRTGVLHVRMRLDLI